MQNSRWKLFHFVGGVGAFAIDRFFEELSENSDEKSRRDHFSGDLPSLLESAKNVVKSLKLEKFGDSGRLKPLSTGLGFN